MAKPIRLSIPANLAKSSYIKYKHLATCAEKLEPVIQLLFHLVEPPAHTYETIAAKQAKVSRAGRRKQNAEQFQQLQQQQHHHLCDR